MVTRNDVARHAGTSTAVVSYVVNDGPRPVAPETRARVLAAVAELGYRPNAIARSLRAATSNTLGVLLEDHGRRSAALLAGVESVAMDHDVTLVIGTGRSAPDGPARQVRAFVDRQADGLLLLTRVSSAGVVSELARSKTPSIEVFPTSSDLTAEAMQDAFVDEASAVHALLEHLHLHGLTRPLFATSSATPIPGFHDRPDGVLVRAPDEGIGQEVLRCVERSGGHDVVVCGSVPAAIAVDRAFEQVSHDWSRPVVVSVVDDLDDRHAGVLGLTVAGHPWEQIGALATQTLLDRIRDPATDANPIPTVPPQVRCRAGCGAPPGIARGRERRVNREVADRS